MKFAASVAMAVLLLGMPLGCILATCQIDAPAHPCCPRTGANLKCPYDALDSAKVANTVAIAAVPVDLATEAAPPKVPSVTLDPAPPLADRSDSYILNRILRI